MPRRWFVRPNAIDSPGRSTCSRPLRDRVVTRGSPVRSIRASDPIRSRVTTPPKRAIFGGSNSDTGDLCQPLGCRRFERNVATGGGSRNSHPRPIADEAAQIRCHSGRVEGFASRPRRFEMAVDWNAFFSRINHFWLSRRGSSLGKVTQRGGGRRWLGVAF